MLYASERTWATAPDGVQVPVSLVWRKDRPREGGLMYLTGYGSYGFPYPIVFSSNRLSLLDRGYAIGIAHVRGGGDLGKPWHDAGRLGHKMNTFTDFIAVAEHLIAERWTAADQLVIEGGSAGGLLMGAVVNLRPDLFRAVLAQVPFVDVINTMSDTTLPLTVGEFEDWGNPAVEEQYRWMRAYCPYTNLKSGPFPAMLVRTSFNDSQVMYWEPAKYVAKLRTLKTDDQPLLLLTNLGAGHGGASGRYDRLREIAGDYAFILGEGRKAQGEGRTAQGEGRRANGDRLTAIG
jgi:oligopeptidase B